MAAVVITGGAGDLGRALSASFLDDGLTVYAADIRPVAAAPSLVSCQLDVTDRAAVLALAERAAAEAGPLAVWVNAAGIVRVVPVTAAGMADWDRVIAVNLTGCFHGCAAALAVMSRQGSGRIVNVGSLSGQVGGTGVHPAYGASKAGVHALTRTYALEGARHGVFCNAVAPSVIEGAMGAQLSARQRAQLARANPLRRLGRMAEVVAAIRHLASDAASYTNGVILPVNGGSYLA